MRNDRVWGQVLQEEMRLDGVISSSLQLGRNRGPSSSTRENTMQQCSAAVAPEGAGPHVRQTKNPDTLH